MFERFSDPARRVVVLAQHEAQSLGHDFLGTEHLLLGLAAETDSPVARVLAQHGLTKGRIRSYVCLVIGAGMHGPRVDPRIDPAALATLGIDLEQVRRRVEATFGAGALASGQPGKQRDDCAGRRFTPRAKRALQVALDEAQAQHLDRIVPAHIALALLRSDGVAARLLAHHHVTRAVMRTALGDGPDQVAS